MDNIFFFSVFTNNIPLKAFRIHNSPAREALAVEKRTKNEENQHDVLQVCVSFTFRLYMPVNEAIRFSMYSS